VGGSVYASPDATPLADAVVVATNGVITAVGSRSDVPIPQDARVVDCTGKTIVAGFWNSHVHFTEGVWRNAGSAPAAPLAEHMQAMLTKWGFTTVWDLGSDPTDSLPLRKRLIAARFQARKSCLPATFSRRAAIRLSAGRAAAPRGRDAG